MITITENGVRAIREKTALKDGAVGLRLNIKSTGCSGNSYKMEHVMVEDLKADDKFEKDGAVFYVPKMHSWMLAGMVIDFEEDKMKSRFIFSNPNEAGRCGCGESFTVDQSLKH
ncbi:MAG: HesB/IscA family protein [Micavibrio sp.]